MTPDIDPLDLVDPARYAREGYPHAVWTRLRAEAPVAQISPPGYEPFWAITKHSDIVSVSKQPLRFSNAQGIIIFQDLEPGTYKLRETVAPPGFEKAPDKTNIVVKPGLTTTITIVDKKAPPPQNAFLRAPR